MHQGMCLEVRKYAVPFADLVVYVYYSLSTGSLIAQSLDLCHRPIIELEPSLVPMLSASVESVYDKEMRFCKVVRGIKYLRLIMPVVRTGAFMQEHPTKFIDILASESVICRHLARGCGAQKLIHIQCSWEQYGVFGFLPLHGRYIVNEAEEGEMENGWKLSELCISGGILQTVAPRT